MERFAKIAAQALNTVLETPIQASDLEVPPDPKLGDFGFPCFRLAKAYRKSPPQVAEQLVNALKTQEKLPAGLEVSAVGPYVNFTVPRQELMTALLKDILAGSGLGAYGQLPANSRGSWVIEYSSPNVAKPLNIYHLRPTVLGAALDRIGRYRGYQVTAINHLGDWGKQYGMLAVAFKHFGVDINQDLDMMNLVNLYVRINQEAEKDPSLEDQARQAFLKLEQNDPEMIFLWKKCIEVSMKEFNRIYDLLKVRFDYVWGESFYTDQLPSLLEDLRKKGLLIESEGAWVVPVTDSEGNELPPCILQKSDGATIYATRDVAAALYRYQRFHFDRMTYVVGQEQKLHFQQVFSVLRKMGCEWANHCEHVPTGLYRFSHAKMSTRKGNFVTFEDVYQLTVNRVAALMEEREKSQGTAVPAQKEITEAVAIGAIVFHDLHSDPSRDIDFNVERVTDFEGETGPYLQYAHTRCLSILRKARESGELKGEVCDLYSNALIQNLNQPEEIALVKMLGTFPLHLERTLTFSKASQLAHYLVDLTQSFGGFYRECKVLGEKPELTQARLLLVEATRRVLARGLTLLGIPLPERM